MRCHLPLPAARRRDSLCCTAAVDQRRQAAQAAWTGWDDVASLLDLARALQRSGMQNQGFEEPLTDFADSQGISHDSFTVSTVFVTSPSMEEQEKMDTSQYPSLESYIQNETLSRVMNSSRTAIVKVNSLADDGSIVPGGQLGRGIKYDEQLLVYTEEGFPLASLGNAFTHLASPTNTHGIVFANGTDDDNSYFHAEAWGCYIRREPGLAVRAPPDHLVLVSKKAISLAVRVKFNASLADCGPNPYTTLTALVSTPDATAS